MKLGPPLLYAATAAGLALTVRSLLGSPLPMVPAAALLLAYGGLVYAGLKLPWLEMWGETTCRVRRGVAITLDDPGDLALARVAELDTPCTVFATAEDVEARRELFENLVDAGHAIGIAGGDRAIDLAWLPWEQCRDELVKARDRIEAVTGEAPRHVRARSRTFTPRLLRGAEETGLAVVGWTPGPAKNGGIVDATGRGVEAVLREAAARQVKVVPL